MCCEVIWNLSFFLSNCTAPIYCNVIKNSYCECLSQFPLQEFQVTEHPTNSMCLAVVLHSFLYFCWCCLSQNSYPCPPWCPCLSEGQLLTAGGSAEELSWCGKSFSHQCGGRNWSTCISSQGTAFCHHFVNSVLEFYEDGAASPLPPPQVSCNLRNACSAPGWDPLELFRNSSQELVLSEELLLCNQQPWKLILPAWRTPLVEQYFCFWNFKGSYLPGLWSGWKIAVTMPTIKSGPEWGPWCSPGLQWAVTTSLPLCVAPQSQWALFCCIWRSSSDSRAWNDAPPSLRLSPSTTDKIQRYPR